MKKFPIKSIALTLSLILVFSIFAYSGGVVKVKKIDPASSNTSNSTVQSVQTETILSTENVSDTFTTEIQALDTGGAKDDASTLKLFAEYLTSSDYWKNVGVSLKDPVKNLGKPSSTEDLADQAERVLYDYLRVFANNFVDVICALLPTPKTWINVEDYVNNDFYPGHDTFISTPASNAKWNLGYSSASLIPSDFAAGKYFMGGSLKMGLVYANEVIDDQRVRVVAVNDGSGRGTTIFAVVDALGISNVDVCRIREKLADFAKANNIVSINISATHTHSAIDMQGFGSPFIPTIVMNAIKNEYDIFGSESKSGRTPDFMNNAYNVTARAIKEAFNNMTAGDLYYSTVDGSEYLKDKREPISFEKDFASLRFVPANGSKQTYFVNVACHPTILPHTTTQQVSSDYIYYMDQEFIEQGYNFLFFQGPVGGMTRVTDNIGLSQNATDLEIMDKFGRALAKLILSIDKSTEEKLTPVLNVKHKEFLMECDNKILLLAVKSEVVNSRVVKTGKGMNDRAMATELGYVEFGNRVAFGLLPAEMYPEIVVGGTMSKENSWNNTAWEYKPMVDMVPNGVDLYVVSFANDTFGYVMPDNNFAMFAPGHNDEMLSAGPKTASRLTSIFQNFVEGIVRT